MGTKHAWKSKTILFSLVTIIVAIFNLVGGGGKPAAEMTWEELGQRQNQQTDNVANMLILLGGGGAVYGRYQAKDRIGGKKQ